jgi:hypothetical protein
MDAGEVLSVLVVVGTRVRYKSPSDEKTRVELKIVGY